MSETQKLSETLKKYKDEYVKTRYFDEPERNRESFFYDDHPFWDELEKGLEALESQRDQLKEQLENCYALSGASIREGLKIAKRSEAAEAEFVKQTNEMVVLLKAKIKSDLELERAEASAKALTEKADKWDKFRESLREHKCNYGIVCAEKLDLETRLANALKWVEKMKMHPYDDPAIERCPSGGFFLDEDLYALESILGGGTIDPCKDCITKLVDNQERLAAAQGKLQILGKITELVTKKLSAEWSWDLMNTEAKDLLALPLKWSDADKKFLTELSTLQEAVLAGAGSDKIIEGKNS